MGWGTGGRPVEAVLEVKGVQQLVEERFAAGVAIHPIGWPDGVEAAPLLILVGDKDDCFPAARIQRAMQEGRSRSRWRFCRAPDTASKIPASRTQSTLPTRNLRLAISPARH